MTNVEYDGNDARMEARERMTHDQRRFADLLLTSTLTSPELLHDEETGICMFKHSYIRIFVEFDDSSFSLSTYIYKVADGEEVPDGEYIDSLLEVAKEAYADETDTDVTVEWFGDEEDEVIVIFGGDDSRAWKIQNQMIVTEKHPLSMLEIPEEEFGDLYTRFMDLYYAARNKIIDAQTGKSLAELERDQIFQIQYRMSRWFKRKMRRRARQKAKRAKEEREKRRKEEEEAELAAAGENVSRRKSKKGAQTHTGWFGHKKPKKKTSTRRNSHKSDDPMEKSARRSSHRSNASMDKSMRRSSHKSNASLDKSSRHGSPKGFNDPLAKTL